MHATVLVLGEDVEELMDPYSEHDPDAVEAFWDSWVIGGRGEGHLIVRERGGGVLGGDSTHRKVLQRASCVVGRHQVRCGDLDLERMRGRVQEAAEVAWPMVDRALQAHGAPKTLEQISRESGAGDAWYEWRRQPGMTELHPFAELVGGLSQEWPVSREEFIARARLQALPCEAFLSAATGWVRSYTYDAQWNRLPVPGYAQMVNRMVEQAPADTLLTCVDYHC